MEKMNIRQSLINEINNLKNDFRLLFLLRKYHKELYNPLNMIIRKIRACKKLLTDYPEVKCLGCSRVIN